jgi:hypothetical protein
VGHFKQPIFAAGLLVLWLAGCGQSERASATVAQDAAAHGVDGARPPRTSEPDAPPPSSSSDSGARTPSDAGAKTSDKDAGTSSSEADAGSDASPPSAADAATAADPFAAEPEPSGPQIVIDFPPADARTTQAQLHVRGRVIAAQGGRLALDGANIDIDASGHWSTSVALAPGKNTLKLELAVANQRVRAVRNIRSEPIVRVPAGIALDLANNRGYLVDRDTLQSVDLDTGERRLISGAARGQGPALSGATSIAFDAANKRVFIGAAGPVVFTVDVESGDRRVSTVSGTDASLGVLSLSVAQDGRVLVTTDTIAWFDPARGTSTPLSPQPQVPLPPPDPTFPTTIRQVGWISGPDQAYVVIAGMNGTKFGVFSTNLSTGASTLVSDASRGTGPELGLVTSMTFDPAANAAYIVNYNEAVVRVDLQTGDRTLLTGRERGNGPMWRNAGKVAFDAARHRMLATIEDGLLDVSLDTGDRKLISSNQNGSEVSLPMARGLWITPAGNHVITSETIGGDESRLLAFDLRSGQRKIVVAKIPGAQLALDGSASPLRALVVQRSGRSVSSVQLNDGTTTLISTKGRGFGQAFLDPLYIAFDPTVDAKNAYVVDGRTDSAPSPPMPAPYAIVRVDLANGERTIVSDAFTGTGPNSRLGWLAVDAKRKRLVSFVGNLFVFDLQTAERKCLGEVVSVMDQTQVGLTLDVDGDRVLLTDAQNGIASLDLESGAYKQLSAPGPDIELVFGLAAVPHRQLAVVLSYGVLVVVDLTTGERVIIS